MIILGIDPGIAIIGYGIIEVVGSSIKLLEYGCITTSSKSPVPKRLSFIMKEMSSIIEEFKPDEMAIEELFFNKNAKTVINVAQARGVEILAGIEAGLPIYEYTPLQIKQAIVGYGRAEKIQVQETIKTILRLSEIPKPDDAADAIAVAICHSFSRKFKELYEMR
ncbi:crossover junction endodeoxyribonuclease RuvC [Miniphocaeibacter halophilus]|uniref:Crossover junction endodeoxyribonuclease RuvC n=1 Tax=Miniphocaeibacter halophilus TaxID=2931922 RepID=A0AC61N2P6_9FIRM|nr:crossover junction endodeoxyribonuclease RuvC [Miniphocaeibacter halophilus]QQK07808.1 crossover junction endodeoxyribonuclease RuvC [Miniphocaeibacter halophilus]